MFIAADRLRSTGRDVENAHGGYLAIEKEWSALISRKPPENIALREGSDFAVGN